MRKAPETGYQPPSSKVKNPDLTVGVSPQLKLRLSRILLALMFDVPLDHRLIHTHGRHKVPV
jgi:hypothetical protein